MIIHVKNKNTLIIDDYKFRCCIGKNGLNYYKSLKEHLFRHDNKYDYIISISHNEKKIPNKGSAVFIHLTDNYRPTLGCVALKKKDFEILLKLINKKTKIKIG